MKLTKIAIRYATALYEATEAQKATEAVVADFNGIKTLIKDSTEFNTLVNSPKIQQEDRDKLIQDSFKDVNDLTLTFLRLLVKKNRLSALADCITEFERLIDLKSGIVHAEAIGSVKLSDSQISSIKSNLESQLKMTVNITDSVDKTIIGGYIVRINDTMIDHSISNQLAKLKDSLLAG